MKTLLPLLILLLVACKGKTSHQSNSNNNRRSMNHKITDSYEMSDYERKELERKKRLISLSISDIEKFEDSTQVNLEGEKTGSNHIDFKLKVDMLDSIEIPDVQFGRMRMKVRVSRLAVVAKIYDSKIGYLDQLDGEAPFSLSRKEGDVEFSISPEQLRKLKVGKHQIKIEIQTYLESIHGDRSYIQPASMDVEFDFDVDPIYSSTVYFQELALNEKESRKILGGGNDHSNSTPEACIKIRTNSETLIYEYAKNNFNLKRNLKKKFYHNSLKDELRIMAMDADYFLNSDDLISSAYISVDSLLGNSYKNIPLKATDKLLIYCTTEGQINKN